MDNSRKYGNKFYGIQNTGQKLKSTLGEFRLYMGLTFRMNSCRNVYRENIQEEEQKLSNVNFATWIANKKNHNVELE